MFVSPDLTVLSLKVIISITIVTHFDFELSYKLNAHEYVSISMARGQPIRDQRWIGGRDSEKRKLQSQIERINIGNLETYVFILKQKSPCVESKQNRTN